MSKACRLLPLLLALCACAHFKAARQRPKLLHPLERGAYGLELGQSSEKIDRAAARLHLADQSGRFRRADPVALRSYEIERGTAAHVTVTLVDGRVEGVMVAFSSAAPSFDALAAELKGRYGPPQLEEDPPAAPDRYRDLYWSDGWVVLRLSQRRIDMFDERFMEVAEVPRLGKIGFARFALDKTVVFGAKGFAVREAALSTAPAPGCVSGDMTGGLDQRVREARQAVYDGNFAAALERSNDIIQGGLQDEQEALAWQARAAALFRLGRKAEAVAAWRSAYEIDDCLTDIPAYLKSQGL